MSQLDRVTDAVGQAGLTLRRAWPRDAAHLLLDVTDGVDHVAGQWFADRERARHVADATIRAARSPDHVQVLDAASGTVVLQRAGADRRLEALAGLLAAPSARLVAHRPERRAVVQHLDADGATVFTKVQRPGRRPTTRTSPPGVRTPRVVAVDEDRGLVTTAALPGVSFHDLLPEAGVRPGRATAAAAATGSALAALHRAVGLQPGPRHDAGAELQVVERWLAWAGAYGVLPDDAGRRLGQVRRLLAEPADPTTALLHRDLHDKQVVVDEDDSVGLLDFDLAAVGEPALDLANLLVHLELRVHQGRLDPGASRRCADAFVEAYAPGRATRRRVAAYSAATRLRLACVYAFRPGGRAAVQRHPGTPVEGDHASLWP